MEFLYKLPEDIFRLILDKYDIIHAEKMKEIKRKRKYKRILNITNWLNVEEKNNVDYVEYFVPNVYEKMRMKIYNIMYYKQVKKFCKHVSDYILLLDSGIDIRLLKSHLNIFCKTYEYPGESLFENVNLFTSEDGPFKLIENIETRLEFVLSYIYHDIIKRIKGEGIDDFYAFTGDDEDIIESSDYFKILQE